MRIAFALNVLNVRRPAFALFSRIGHFVCLLALVLGLALISFASSHTAQARQTIPVIHYGQSVKGSIGNSVSTDAVIYNFQAKVGDLVLITMTRTSSTLRPLIGLLDQSQPSGKKVLSESTLSADGKIATLVDYVITKSAQYQIVATRENVDKGTTSGNFTLALANDAATPPTPTIEPTTAGSGAGTQTFVVGTAPVYSVWSGNNLYVANQGDGTVSILSGDGTVTGLIQTGGAPFAMSWDGARLWVADFGTDAKPGNTVTLYDAVGKKVNTFKVGKQPFSLSYDPDDILTWIAIYGDDKVVAVDAHGKIVHSVDVSSQGHGPNTVLWTGTQVWVTLQGTATTPDHTVLAIDPSGTITSTVKVGQAPADLAWDETDQFVFVANNTDGTITTIGADGNVVGTHKVGTSPNALAWDGSHLWVTLGTENTVAVLDKNGKILTKIPLDNIPNGITYDGQADVWVALQGSTTQPGNSIVQIDVNTAVGSGN